MGDENPAYAPFFGVMGAAAAIIFSGKFAHKTIDLSYFSWRPLTRNGFGIAGFPAFSSVLYRFSLGRNRPARENGIYWTSGRINIYPN